MTTGANSGCGSWWKFSEACKGSWKIWMRKQPGSGFNQDRAGLLQRKKTPNMVGFSHSQTCSVFRIGSLTCFGRGTPFFRILLKAVKKKILKRVERKFIPTALTEK